MTSSGLMRLVFVGLICLAMTDLLWQWPKSVGQWFWTLFWLFAFYWTAALAWALKDLPDEDMARLRRWNYGRQRRRR